MSEIGSKIYKLRKLKGISQEELGYELGVSRQTISKWELNAMQPAFDNIKALCIFFNVGSEYFFSDEVTSEQAPMESAVTKVESPKPSKRNKAWFTTLFLSAIFSVTILIGIIFAIVYTQKDSGTSKIIQKDLCYEIN